MAQPQMIDQNSRSNAWLVVWIIFVFPYIGKNHPKWLIFFRGVGQPPTSNAVKNDPFFHRDAEIWRWRPSCSWCGVESAALTSRRRAQAASWQVIDRWNLCVLKGGTSHLPQPVLDPYKLDSIWFFLALFSSLWGSTRDQSVSIVFLMFSHFWNRLNLLRSPISRFRVGRQTILIDILIGSQQRTQDCDHIWIFFVFLVLWIIIYPVKVASAIWLFINPWPSQIEALGPAFDSGSPWWRVEVDGRAGGELAGPGNDIKTSMFGYLRRAPTWVSWQKNTYIIHLDSCH